MYRLLIVDDEPAIVNGLLKIFSENESFEFDIYKAYSATQAIEIVKNNRIDILLSDINMPGINGIKMSESVLFYWPSCRIIFLTGYNDFEYIYEAIHKPYVNYILKSENDYIIVEAVENAAKQIKQDIEKNFLLEQAKEQIDKYNHFLKKELLGDILSSETLEIHSLDNQFKNIGIELDISQKIFLLVARVDGFEENTQYTKRANILFSIIESIKRSTNGVLIQEGLIFEKNKIVWIVQPSKLSNRVSIHNDSDDLSNMIAYIRNSIEAIQDSSKEILNVTLSFALGSSFVTWQDAWMEFEVLKKSISRNFAKNNSMIIDLGRSETIRSEKIRLSNVSDINSKIKNLEKLLIEGNILEVETVCISVFNEISSNIDNNMISSELYHRLLLEFAEYINKYGLSERIVRDLNLRSMIFFDIPNELENAQRFFVGLGNYICMFNKEEDKSQEALVISKLERYIRENSGGDLSLVKLSQIVYLNPSYLSRFYKQITGKNLSDFINEVKLEQAKIMLIEPNVKVSDIALKLGFDSASYFSLFFRKMTGTRPLEYRSLFSDK